MLKVLLKNEDKNHKMDMVAILFCQKQVNSNTGQAIKPLNLHCDFGNQVGFFSEWAQKQYHSSY